MPNLLDGSFSTGGYPQRSFRTFSKTDKSKEIKQHEEDKTARIMKFNDAKSTQIAVSSAFNGAWDMVVALVSVGKLDPIKEDIWNKHGEFYAEFLQFFLDAQDDAAKEFMNVKFNKVARVSEQQQRGLDEAENDVSDNIINAN
jgi:Zn/Cd-binding protein ZinT